MKTTTSTTLFLFTQMGDVDHGEHNGALQIIFPIVCGCILLWKFWPQLKENNIFSGKPKYDYGRGEEVIERKKTASANLLGIVLMAGLAGLAVAIYRLNVPVDEAIYSSNSKAQPLRAASFFGFSFAGTIAALIYTLIDVRGFAMLPNIKYALKTWLTTIIAPTILCFIIGLLSPVQIFPVNNLFIIPLAHGTGIITLTILVFITRYATIQSWSVIKKRRAILLVTQTSLLINILVVGLATGASISVFFMLVIPYQVTMGLGIWFYPMDTTVYSDPELLDAEEIS